MFSNLPQLTSVECDARPINTSKPKMTETLAYGYSSENTRLKLCNKYTHGKFQMVSKDLCILMLSAKVALPVEELINEWINEGLKAHQHTKAN